MANLILNSLEVRNYRAFRDLKIERLGRVNLLVGKNNVGKTSLLEAIKKSQGNRWGRPLRSVILMQPLSRLNSISHTTPPAVATTPIAMPASVARLDTLRPASPRQIA